MSDPKRKRFSLAKATKVNRLHDEQVQPPQLLEALNTFISKSDYAITLRPDLTYLNESHPSPSQYLQGHATPGRADFLANLVYSLGTSRYCYFSRMIPYGFSGGAQTVLYSTYTTGTITTDGTVFVRGSGTSWLQQVWAGCFIENDDTGLLYYIAAVLDDDVLKTDEALPAVADQTYTIYRTHHIDHGRWWIHYEGFTEQVVYNAVKVVAPLAAQDISGPFYSNIAQAEIEGVWDSDDHEPTVPSLDPNCIAGSDIIYDGYGDDYDYLTVGLNGRVLNTAAFSTWTLHQMTPEVLYGCDQGYAAWLVCGAQGQMWRTTVNAPDDYGAWADWSLAGVTADLFAVIYHSSDNLSGGVIESNWIVVGAGGTLLVEADGAGIPFTSETSGTTATLRAIASNHVDLLVIVGDDDGTDAVILTADPADLTTWTARSSGAGGAGESLFGVAQLMNADAWVAVGTNGTILSGDAAGTTWTDETSGVTDDLNAVAADARGNLAIAVGEDDTVLTSDDLSSWTAIAITGATGSWKSICWKNDRGLFALCGWTDKVATIIPYVSLTAPSGDVATIGTHSNVVIDLMYNGTQWLACGKGGVWTCATIGGSWASGSVTDTMVAMAYETGTPTYVAVGLGGKVWSTGNAHGVGGWTSRTSNTTEDLYSIAWDGTNFVAVGGNGAVIYSPDGTTWTAVASGVAQDLYCITHQVGTSSYAGGSNGVMYWIYGAPPTNVQALAGMYTDPTDDIVSIIKDVAPYPYYSSRSGGSNAYTYLALTKKGQVYSFYSGGNDDASVVSTLTGTGGAGVYGPLNGLAKIEDSFRAQIVATTLLASSKLTYFSHSVDNKNWDSPYRANPIQPDAYPLWSDAKVGSWLNFLHACPVASDGTDFYAVLSHDGGRYAPTIKKLTNTLTWAFEATAY